MKKLIPVIAWLESRRLRHRYLLLIALLLFASLIIGSCDMRDFSISLQTDNQVPQAWLDLISLVPVFSTTLFALGLGFAILLSLPFRGQEEWQSGQFQMIVMGDYKQTQITLARFLVYLAISSAFLATMTIMAMIYADQEQVVPGLILAKFALLISYWFLALMPLSLAFGLLVSAVRTAYYRDGQGKLLAFVIYLGVFGFFILIKRIALYFSAPDQGLLAKLPIDFSFNGNPVTVGLNIEFPLISLMIAVLFLFLAGRILDEVEA